MCTHEQFGRLLPKESPTPSTSLGAICWARLLSAPLVPHLLALSPPQPPEEASITRHFPRFESGAQLQAWCQLLGQGAGDSRQVSVGFIHPGDTARASRLPALELEDACPVLAEGLPQELVGVAPRVWAHLDVQLGKLVAKGLGE